MQNFGIARSSKFGFSALAAFELLCLVTTCPAAAGTEPYHLAPLTKLRLTVVQFMPTTGDYRRWDALGGDLAVSPDGTILVPALGTMRASSLSADELATEIAGKLQDKLGLVDRPEATIQVLDYPPIYLVGGVATPGQYPYRPGMTVLQAVAIAGGEFRAQSQSSLSETIKLQADLQGIDDDMLRSTARVARLEAELSGAKAITFPSSLDQHDPVVAAIMHQEQTIFAARENELTRQTTALGELSALYKAELDVLDQKGQSVDEQIRQVQLQLDGVKTLVEKGVLVVSRQTDLERAIAGLRSDRLDNLIATMSARQGLNEATRNLAKLEDDQQSEVSLQLQTEQTSIDRLQRNQTTSMRLLRQATEFASNTESKPGDPQTLAYTIIRQQDGQASDLPASDLTPLMPGDLLKVAVVVGVAPEGRAAGPVASAAIPVTGTSP